MEFTLFSECLCILQGFLLFQQEYTWKTVSNQTEERKKVYGQQRFTEKWARRECLGDMKSQKKILKDKTEIMMKLQAYMVKQI